MVETSYTTVASGDSQSGIISNLRANRMGILVSIPTSCAVYLRASMDTSSANFRRVTTTVYAGGDFVWNVGSGNKAVEIGDVAAVFPYLKLETGVAQTAVASITVITKF